jgi:putative transposase
VARIRRNAAHQLTNSLVKHHTLIAIEDLHVAAMLKNHALAGAVSDSNFREIRRQLEYKASWHGVYLVVIDRWFPSSKKCSACGRIDEDQDLRDRVFICQECGLVIDRDLNAARNILAEAVRPTASSAGSNASEVGSAGLLSGASETSHVEGGTNHLCGVSTKV